MNRERENNSLPGKEELDEDLILLSYAVQEGIPIESIFSGLGLGLDPETGFDRYFGETSDQQYYMFMQLLHPRGPVAVDLELESRKMINGLWQYKDRFLNDPIVRKDVSGFSAVSEMNPEGLTDFLEYMHSSYLQDALDEYTFGNLSDDTVSKLVYWSNMDKIGQRVLMLFEEDAA